MIKVKMTAREERESKSQPITSVGTNDIENAVETIRDTRLGFIMELDEVDETFQNKWNSIKTLLETKKESLQVDDIWSVLDNEDDLERLVIVEETQGSGMTLLHIALDNEAPIEVIQILLEADVQKSSLYYAEVLEKIIEVHLLVMDNEEQSQSIVQDWIDKHLATPMLLCITSSSFEKSMIVEDKGRITVPVQLYRHLAAS